MKKKGFTLIELLVVIAIIAILAGIVIIAVNPARQIAQARNAQRRADVLTTLNAVYQFYLDNGAFPTGIIVTPNQLGTETTGCRIADTICGTGWRTNTSCLNLSTALVPNYISDIPVDPSPQGTPERTGYAIRQENNRITVRACYAELDTTIEVTR